MLKNNLKRYLKHVLECEKKKSQATLMQSCLKSCFKTFLKAPRGEARLESLAPEVRNLHNYEIFGFQTVNSCSMVGLVKVVAMR